MLQEIENMNNSVHHMELIYWLSNDVFSFQWWIIFILNALFLLLLVLLIDRNRILLISLTFMCGLIIITTIDNIGTFLGWWSYPHQFIPFTGDFNAVDFAVVPVTIALCYQLFTRWNMYFVITLGLSLLYSYIGLPLLVYLNITKLTNWNYTRSFLVLFAASLLVKVIVDAIGRKIIPSNFEEENERRNIHFLRRKQKAR